MEIKEPKFDVQKNFGASGQRPLRNPDTTVIEIGESIQLFYRGKPVLVRVVKIEKENEVLIGEIYDLDIEGLERDGIALKEHVRFSRSMIRWLD